MNTYYVPSTTLDTGDIVKIKMAVSMTHGLIFWWGIQLINNGINKPITQLIINAMKKVNKRK